MHELKTMTNQTNCGTVQSELADSIITELTAAEFHLVQ
jgi:hypothetical protein